MRTQPTPEEIKEILRLHAMWRRGEPEGRRANLSRANLSRADLSGANLSDADLSRADLSGANLSDAYLGDADLSGANLGGANLGGANLGGANLRGADLSDANLSEADLQPIRREAWLLALAYREEAPALIRALELGQVDGTVYTGRCSCLCGTIASVRAGGRISNGADLPVAMSSSPIERFAGSIDTGDTPATSQPSKLLVAWLREALLTIGIDPPISTPSIVNE